MPRLKDGGGGLKMEFKEAMRIWKLIGSLDLERMRVAVSREHGGI